MDRYPICPLEELSDEQLDNLLGDEWKATPDDISHIHTELKERVQRRKPRRQIAIVALVAALTLSLVGFANADRIQLLFGRYFGSQQLSMYANDITDSSTENGFTLKAITAVKDGSDTYLFMDLTAEEGGKLSDDLTISICDADGIGKDLGETVTSMYGIGCELVEYDDQTATATIVAHLIGDFNGDQAIFTLRSFATGKKEISSILDVNLFDAVDSAQPEFMSFEYMEKNGVGYGYGDEDEFKSHNMTPEDMECLNPGDLQLTSNQYDFVEVSNLGYKDGLLHIQTRTRTLLPEDRAYPELRDQKSNVLSSLYQTSFGFIDSGMGLIASEYNEYVYDIGSLENLKNCTFGFYGHYYENTYGGKWQIKMDVPENMLTAEYDINRIITTDRGDVHVQKIVVTPISATIILDATIEQAPEVSAVYRDGTVTMLKEGGMFTYEDGKQERRYTGTFIDMEKLAYIKINSERIAVE